MRSFFCLRHEVHRQMVLIESNKIYCSFSYLLHNFIRQQFFDRFHERWLAVSSLRSPLSRTIVKSFSNRVRGDHFLHVVSEFAEKLVVQADGPVLGKEFNNVRNKAIIVSTADTVQVLIWQSNKTGKRRDNNILWAEIAHVFDDPVGIDWKLDVVTLKLFDILAEKFFAANSTLQNCFWQGIIGPLDVVIDHISEESTAHTHWHVQTRQLLISVFLCC